jgi:hypothetical protein
MKKITLANLPAKYFSLSFAITKEINYTKLGISYTNHLFVGSDSVINRETQCNAQRYILQRLLHCSYSLNTIFKILACEHLTDICTYICNIYTVIATLPRAYNQHLCILATGLCIRSRDPFPMVSLEFFIDIILPAALWTWS